MHTPSCSRESLGTVGRILNPEVDEHQVAPTLDKFLKVITNDGGSAWTRGGAKQVESIQAARKARAIHDRDEAVALKDAIEGGKVRLAVKAGAAGRLFGSVKTDHVADAVAAAGIGAIDKRKVTITSPIKSTGDHEATVRLHEDVIAVITLQVVAAK